MGSTQFALEPLPPTALAEELRSIPAFADLSPEDRLWLASRMELQTLERNELIRRAGDPAEHMTVILEGEIRAKRESDPNDPRVFIGRTGQVTGMLPFSRLKSFPLVVRAMAPTRVAQLHKDHFQDMLFRIPQLGQRLVSLMTDRVREATKVEFQREKLLALSKLSAGLAHELNNPASAAQNAARSLKEAAGDLKRANLQLDKRGLTPELQLYLAELECSWSGTAPEDPMERSDREERIGGCLAELGVPGAYELAAGLVDAGFDEPTLEKIAERFPEDALADVFLRLSASSAISRLSETVDSAMTRITAVVGALKEYTYMDQAPEQELDIHQGIENTLTVLAGRLKDVRVVKNYEPGLPLICAKGSELNQVWTNLIDNAIDAMCGCGELRIRTGQDLAHLIVEIGDSGPGIPQEIQSRVFEPFFTTKPMGAGMGLGLDIVWRIIQSHRGEVTLESKPGDTRFQVRLPLMTSLVT